MSQLWGKRIETLMGPEDTDEIPFSSMEIIINHPQSDETYTLDGEISMVEVSTPKHLIGGSGKMWNSIHKKSPWDRDIVSSGIYYRIRCTNISKHIVEKLSGIHTSATLINTNANIEIAIYIIEDEKHNGLFIILNDMCVTRIQTENMGFEIKSLKDLTKFSWR